MKNELGAQGEVDRYEKPQPLTPDVFVKIDWDTNRSAVISCGHMRKRIEKFSQ